MGRFKVRTVERVELSPTFATRAEAEKWADTVAMFYWRLRVQNELLEGWYFGGLHVYDAERVGDMSPEQAEIAELCEKLEVMTAEHDRAIRGIDTARRQRDEHMLQRDEALAKVAELRAELEAMTAACDCYREAMNRARAKLAATPEQAEIAELREQLEVMTAERDEARRLAVALGHGCHYAEAHLRDNRILLARFECEIGTDGWRETIAKWREEVEQT